MRDLISTTLLCYSNTANKCQKLGYSNDNEKNVKHLLYMEDFKLYTANHDQVEEALDVQRGHQEGVQNGQVFYRHHQKRQTFKRNSCVLRKISSRPYQKGLQISGDSENTRIKRKKKNWSRSTDLKLEIEILITGVQGQVAIVCNIPDQTHRTITEKQPDIIFSNKKKYDFPQRCHYLAQ